MSSKHAHSESSAYENDTSVYSRYSYDPEAAHERSRAEVADVFAHAQEAASHVAAEQPSGLDEYSAAYMAAMSQGPEHGPVSARMAAHASQAPVGDSQFPGFESLNNAKKHSAGKIVLRIFGVLLALLIIAAVIVGLFVSKYMHDLDAILDEGEPPMDTSVLTPAKDGEPFYMLAVGLDTRNVGDLGPGSYSDAIMLVRVDMAEKQLTMVSIPRDTRWVMPDGTVEKINAAYFNGGVDACVGAVEQKSGVKVSHVMVFDYSDLEEIVDSIGGVEVNVETRLYKGIVGSDSEPITLEPGLQTLSGAESEVFAGDRFSYDTDQEANRQSNIRKLMEAIVRKIAKTPKSELPDTLMGLAPYLHTDMRSIDFVKLGWDYLWSQENDVMFYSTTAPYAGDIDYWYDERWYCFENPRGWEELMSVVGSGGDPSRFDFESTVVTHEERNAAAEEEDLESEEEL